MNGIQNNNENDNKIGISMSDGRDVFAPKPGSEVYLDSLTNSGDDIKDLKKIKAREMTPADKKVISILAVLNVIVVAVIGIYLAANGGGDEYESIKENMNFDADKDYFNVSQVFGDELSMYLNGVEFPENIQNYFKPLYSANTDTVGWIKIPETSIDFPVLKAEDNAFYERKNFYGGYDRRGSIFMDYRNTVGKGRDGLSKNTIVYGHHLTQDECVFADVEKYLDPDYYAQHPVITMNTLYDDYKWKVFACYITNANEKDDNGFVFYYWYPFFSDDNTLNFANETLSRSWFINPSIDFKPTDKFLTLSTCTYIMNVNGKFVDARCVLVARLVRAGESEEVDVSQVYENTNKRLPQIWFDTFGGTNNYADGPFWSAYA